jgi:hypothetical protein
MHEASSSRSLHAWSRRRPLTALVMFGVLACVSGSAFAGPAPLPRTQPASRTPALQELVDEASRRFGVPASWIVEVMSVESRGRANALSPKGAIGPMQVMPSTYADLAARHGLGSDPWNPRDNVLAGVAYLREMFDRYGATGMLAAYNAGPGRWDDYRLRARPLPAETLAYLSRLGPVVGGSVLPMPTFAGWSAPRSPFTSPLFVRLASVSASVPLSAERERVLRIIDANASVVGRADAIFVTRRSAADLPSDRQSDAGRAAETAPSERAPAAAGSLSTPPRNPLFPQRTSAESQQ